MIDNRLYSLRFRFDNPVFNHDLRRIQGPRQLPELTRFVRRTIVVICVLAVLLWLIGGISTLGFCKDPSSSYYRYYDFCSYPSNVASGPAGVVILVIALVGLLVGLVIDIYYVNLPISNILRERDSGYLDLLRLTKLSALQVVAAKYMSIQFRAWPMTAIEIGLRVATMMFMVLLSFLTSGHYLIFPIEVSYITGPVLVALSGVYVLEPVWRTRAVVAMGLAVAMQTGDFTSATLMAFGSVFAMRILQIVVAIGFVIGTYMIMFLSAVGGESIAVVCATWFIGGMFAVIVYFFYRTVRGWALDRAMMLAARVE